MKNLKKFEDHLEEAVSPGYEYVGGEPLTVKELMEILKKYPERTEIRIAFKGEMYETILGPTKVNNSMEKHDAWKDTLYLNSVDLKIKKKKK